MKTAALARGPALFVWTVWFSMTALAFAVLVVFAGNVPIAEDWLMVPTLTGHEPNFISWLWAQNNEHRVPLPRLVILAALKISGGDFRSGMAVNIGLLSLVSAAAMVVARRVRHGAVCYRDALFPLLFLNVGHWPNLFSSWQVCFVLPIAVACLLLLILIADSRLDSTVSVVAAALGMVTLPLCGVTGLMFGVPVALLLLWLGIARLSHARPDEHNRRASALLIAAAVLALLLAVLYFRNYRPATWNPPSPGLAATVATSLRFLAFSFGSASTLAWAPFSALALAVVVPTCWLLGRRVFDPQDEARLRTIGILVFSGVLFALAVAMGHGRAGSIPSQGFPLRYAILASPLLCTIFFVWEIHGRDPWRARVPAALFLGLVFLLPLNMIEGARQSGSLQVEITEKVERDIDAGLSRREIARRHGRDLIHWFSGPQLEDHMLMLAQAGIGPFARIAGIRQPPPAQTNSAPTAP